MVVVLNSGNGKTKANKVEKFGARAALNLDDSVVTQIKETAPECSIILGQLKDNNMTYTPIRPRVNYSKRY